jgi:hypothetical protein
MIDSGSIFVKQMELGHRFKIAYFVNEIINNLIANLKITGKFPDKRSYCLNLDNARYHIAQASIDYIDPHKFVRVPHLPYSPDLAPSDFCLFECLKERLARCHATTKEDLFPNVTEILNSISEEESVQVFLNEMRRLEQVISTAGEYI